MQTVERLSLGITVLLAVTYRLSYQLVELECRYCIFLLGLQVEQRNFLILTKTASVQIIFSFFFFY